MSMHESDWLKLAIGAALLGTGAGIAGVGPLAGALGAGTGAAAGGAAAGAGAGGLTMAQQLGMGMAMSGLGQGIGAVQPKYGESIPGQVPSSPSSSGLDFNQLVGPQSRSQPKLQFRDPFATR